jgi:hypothetical protein
MGEQGRDSFRAEIQSCEWQTVVDHGNVNECNPGNPDYDNSENDQCVAVNQREVGELGSEKSTTNK